MKHILITILLLTAVISGCSDNKNKDEYTDYTGKLGNFKIKYPSQWTLRSDNSGFSIVIHSNTPGNWDKFNENITILITRTDGEAKLTENFLRMAIQDAEGNFKGVQIEQAQIGNLNSTPAARFIFTAVENSQKIKVINTQIAKGNWLYIIQCKSLLETYDGYKNQFEKIISSFEAI